MGNYPVSSSFSPSATDRLIAEIIETIRAKKIPGKGTSQQSIYG